MKNNNFKITYAKKSDINEIIKLVHKTINQCFSKFYSQAVVKWFCNYHNIKKLQYELDDGALIGIIRDKDKIAATATYYQREIKRVFVDPDRQREGLGGMLMCELQQKAQKMGNKSIMLFATPRNWKYYKNLGYERICAAADVLDDGSLLAYYRMNKSFDKKEWYIKKATPDDANDICKGQIEAFTKVAKQHNHMDMPPMVETFQDVNKAIDNGVVLVAKKDDKIIGSVRGEAKNNACYISRLWVLPQYQKLGIGDALMFQVEEAFNHLKTYELFTGSNSKGTIKFYEERGYLIAKHEIYRDYELVYFEKLNAIELLL